MTKFRFDIVSKVLAFLISVLLLWFSAGLIDYMRVIILYRKPVFCVANSDENGGFYHGLGYTYTIRGNFSGEDSSNDPYGVHYAKLEIFGNEVKVIYRGVHE